MAAQQEPRKPQKRPREAYDYREVISYLERKYRFSADDFSSAMKHFDQWCDARGYGSTDPEGTRRGSSKVWFTEYQRAPDGKKKCPPHQSFWHWIVADGEIGNGSEFILDVGDLLDDDDGSLPDFVRTILGHIRDEFGDELEMHVSW